MPTALHTARYPATNPTIGAVLPTTARAYKRTTGTTVGSIIAAIIATHITRNAANDIVDGVPMGIDGPASMDIVDWVSICIPSPCIPAALTTDHHQPRPAAVSRTAGNHKSVHGRPRIALL